MKKRIAINGFGRIGRLVLRELLQRIDTEIVAINDLSDVETLAHLFEFDSSQGKFQGKVESRSNQIEIDGRIIKIFSKKNPVDLPWKELDIDIVLECTGLFRDYESSSKHLEAGAKRVIISAPAKGDLKTVVRGINDNILNSTDSIFSNASCTTNCLAPILKIIQDNWGIEQVFLGTVHAYTADQNLQDSSHKDLRRARAAAVNIIPTSTGAGDALALIFPELKGKMSTSSLRVPVVTGSLVEVIAVLSKKPDSVEVINNIFKNESLGHFKGVLEYCSKPIVSSDIIGNKHSTIFDSELTILNSNFLKITAWYDNEAGYAARLAEVASY
jgi:glyceraldehyde 3-phosphate dehydrogenase